MIKDITIAIMPKTMSERKENLGYIKNCAGAFTSKSETMAHIYRND